jgi:formate C-acetyltransferase
MTTERKMLSYRDRLEALRATKLAQTREKIELTGYKDQDDLALILPPADLREIIQTTSSSGLPISDCILKGFTITPNHPSGGFFGPKAVGENFKRLMEEHPVFIDPNSSLVGSYMANFMSYRNPHWNPDLDYSHLKPEIQKYKLVEGIGGVQHFCQNLQIGLTLGWAGILEKIHYYRRLNSPKEGDFYDGLEAIVRGLQVWISHYVIEARRMAGTESNPQFRENLIEIATVNEWIIAESPISFREACQWILWYQIMARMYNGSGSLGRLDVLLYPYYLRDKQMGLLDDEEAMFHLACLLLHDTSYIQLGGPDVDGEDLTNPVSFLILEAAHRMKIPANIGICVGDHVDPNLLRIGVQILFQDKTGIPKFLGVDQTTKGFVKNGYPVELARQRAYSGCHWSALPGREYTLNDIVKINFAAIFEIALCEMMDDSSIRPSVEILWDHFEQHLRRAVEHVAKCMDFHIDNMHKVFPELVLDLLCDGPIEKGADASHGGVEYYRLGVDGAALATTADSFAALEQRVDKEKRLTWQELASYLKSNWSGTEGERARLLMHNIARYGSGGSCADEYAIRISQLFTGIVIEKPTPSGYKMAPGLFSWVNTISMGKDVGATPNGRRSGEPISHGANPDPGFRIDGAPTALALAIASVQPGYGNTAPMQIDLDPAIAKNEDNIDLISYLIRTHFKLGGTQINMNILDAARILDANKDPTRYPDLVVRVTGFSAYFASLSPELRQIVVDRIIGEPSLINHSYG